MSVTQVGGGERKGGKKNIQTTPPRAPHTHKPTLAHTQNERVYKVFERVADSGQISQTLVVIFHGLKSLLQRLVPHSSQSHDLSEISADSTTGCRLGCS